MAGRVLGSRTMRYNLLGNTGLYVSELCLGAMTFGGGSGMWQAIGQLGHKESLELVAAAFDACESNIGKAVDLCVKAHIFVQIMH